MGIYTVNFKCNGADKSQSIDSEVASEGDPLRYKSIIDSAIEGWLRDHKLERKNTKIINIEVANLIGKIVAKLGDLDDYQSIT